jgi:hypothetical protein
MRYHWTHLNVEDLDIEDVSLVEQNVQTDASEKGMLYRYGAHG